MNKLSRHRRNSQARNRAKKSHLPTGSFSRGLILICPTRWHLCIGSPLQLPTIMICRRRSNMLPWGRLTNWRKILINFLPFPSRAHFHEELHTSPSFESRRRSTPLNHRHHRQRLKQTANASDQFDRSIEVVTTTGKSYVFAMFCSPSRSPVRERARSLLKAQLSCHTIRKSHFSLQLVSRCGNSPS